MFLNVPKEVGAIPDGTNVHLQSDPAALIWDHRQVFLDGPSCRPSGELLGWQVPGLRWRCDRPKRTYPIEIHSTIRSSILSSAPSFGATSAIVAFDECNRFWTSGYPSPRQIVAWAIEHPKSYLAECAHFIDSLHEMLRVALGDEAKAMKQHQEDALSALAGYYKRIRLCSSTPTGFLNTIATDLRNEVSLQARILAGHHNLSQQPANSLPQRLDPLSHHVKLERLKGTVLDLARVALALSDVKREVVDSCRSHSNTFASLAPSHLGAPPQHTGGPIDCS